MESLLIATIRILDRSRALAHCRAEAALNPLNPVCGNGVRMALLWRQQGLVCHARPPLAEPCLPGDS